MYRSDQRNGPIQAELYTRVHKNFKDEAEYPDEVRQDRRSRRYGRQEAVPPLDLADVRVSPRNQYEDRFEYDSEFHRSPRRLSPRENETFSNPQFDHETASKYSNVFNQFEDRRGRNRISDRQRQPDDRLDNLEYPDSDGYTEGRGVERQASDRLPKRVDSRRQPGRYENITRISPEPPSPTEETYPRGVNKVINKFEKRLVNPGGNPSFRRPERHPDDSFSPESSGNFSPRSFDVRPADDDRPDRRGSPVRRNESHNESRYNPYNKPNDPAYEASNFLDLATRQVKREPSLLRDESPYKHSRQPSADPEIFPSRARQPRREQSLIRDDNPYKHSRQRSSADSAAIFPTGRRHEPDVLPPGAIKVYPEKLNRRHSWDEDVTDFQGYPFEDHRDRTGLLRNHTRPYGAPQTHVNPVFDELDEDPYPRLREVSPRDHPPDNWKVYSGEQKDLNRFEARDKSNIRQQPISNTGFNRSTLANGPERVHKTSEVRAIEELDQAIDYGDHPRSNFNTGHTIVKADGTSNIPSNYKVYSPGEERSSVYSSNLNSRASDQRKSKTKRSIHPCMVLWLVGAAALIVLDLVVDWIFNMYLRKWTCEPETKLSSDPYNLTLGDLTRVCIDKRALYELIVMILTVWGSIISLFQVINILVTVVTGVRGGKFKSMSGLSELQFAIFLREVPQMLLILILSYSCHCSGDTSRLITTFAIVSGFISCLFRYLTAFGSCLGKTGFCNLWWRCLCCKERSDTIDDVTGYKCDVPCAACCLTLRCQSSKCMARCWCYELLKYLPCCVSVKYKDKEQYGLRLMSLFGLFVLLCALVAQLVILVL